MLEFNDIQTTFVVLLAFAAAISSFYAVYKILKELKKPNEDRDKHLEKIDREIEEIQSNHEQDLIEINKKLAKDKEELVNLGRGQRIMLKADLTIIEHALSDNDIEAMKKMKTEIQQYLIDEREAYYR